MWKEGEVVKIAVELQFPKLLCAIVPMLRMFIQVWEEYFDMADLRYLVIDENGLLAEVFLSTFVVYLPNIKQVLLTGNEKQLPPYTGALTDNADITISCYYSAAAKRTAAMGPPSQVYTVNRIVATTRVSIKNVYRNIDFILDPLRATVALSKAKEGVVIVGDQSLLIQSSLWKAYLER